MSARLSGWRVALRVARREALRRRGQTALMLVLVCLPVVAITAAAVVWRTADVSTAEGIERTMGSAQAVVAGSGASSVAQGIDPMSMGFSSQGSPRLSTEADLRRVLGDRPVVEFRREYDAFLVPAGQADVNTVVTDLRSPLTRGLFTLRSGRYPAAADEVLVNPEVAERDHPLGSNLTVVRKTPTGPVEKELTVVGIADSAAVTSVAVIAVQPDALPPQLLLDGSGQSVEPPQWLVGGAPITWDDVRRLNAEGLLATSRTVLLDPPPSSAIPESVREYSPPVDTTVVTVLSLVITMVLIEVVLLAGPAFAVRAKAQARSLALLATAGGTPAQARRTVLATGVVIGGLGGVLGVGLGLAASTAAVPIAQSTVSGRFGPFEVPWALLVVVAAFGLVAAVLAALLPALAAARTDVVAVLGGRRGEAKVSRRSPLVGLALIGAAIACAAFGSRVSVQATQSNSPAMAASALFAVLGMLGLVGVTVALVARLAGRFPLALRFAARDAARHRTRTVPAVAAVAATVAGAVSLGIALDTQQAVDRRGYAPQLASGWASVGVGTEQDDDSDAGAAASAVARTVDSVIGPGRAMPISGAMTTDPSAPSLTVPASFTVTADGEDLYPLTNTSLGSSWIVADAVPDVLGVPERERAAAEQVLREGGAVVLMPAQGQGQGLSGDQVSRTVEGSLRSDLVADDTGQGGATSPASPPQVSTTLRVVAVPGRTVVAQGILPPALVQRLGASTRQLGVVIPPTLSDRDQQVLEERLAGSSSEAYLYVERGFQVNEADRIVRWVLVLLAAVLMLGGTLTATLLALSDARPDLATMAAVGARPTTRRRVAAAYALVVGVVGTLLGGAVGFIPGLAIARFLGVDYATGQVLVSIPWLQLVMIGVGLPLLAAAVVALAARGRLPLVARTA